MTSPTRWFVILSAIAVGFEFAAPAKAGMVFVGSRSDLAGDDYVDWTGTPDPPPSLFSTTSNGGLGVDARLQGLGAVSSMILDLGSLSGYTSLIADRRFSGSVISPPQALITLEFDAPVYGFGADISALTTAGGPIRMTVRDTDGVGHQFTLGTSSYNAFAGARSDTANIVSVEFRAAAGFSIFSTHRARMEVNRVDLVRSPPSPNPVPAPPGVVLLALGAVGLLCRRVSRTPAAG